MQAQFGDEAVKAKPPKAFEDKKSAGPIGDVNMIPLGQRPLKEEKKEPELDPIPEVEWWDQRLLRNPQVCRFPGSSTRVGPDAPLECRAVQGSRPRKQANIQITVEYCVDPSSAAPTGTDVSVRLHACYLARKIGASSGA